MDFLTLILIVLNLVLYGVLATPGFFLLRYLMRRKKHRSALGMLLVAATSAGVAPSVGGYGHTPVLIPLGAYPVVHLLHPYYETFARWNVSVAITGAVVGLLLYYRRSQPRIPRS